MQRPGAEGAVGRLAVSGRLAGNGSCTRGSCRLDSPGQGPGFSGAIGEDGRPVACHRLLLVPRPAMRHWRCISGCGACCRLDPAERGEDLAALGPAQQHAYLQMVGADGWCIHFDTGGRRCRIYEDRPDFCRVENLLSLFGKPDATEAAAADPAASGPAQAARAEALAIQSCRQQIRAEYGGRGRVMRRFERAIRRP